MPISHKDKLLFIHIPKNAGKSFEILFGFHDAYHVAPNMRSWPNRAAKLLLNITSSKNASKQLLGIMDKTLALQHTTLQEMILLNLIDEKILNEYLIVAMVRDPFNRAFSLFNHWMYTDNLSESNIEEEFNLFLSKIPDYRASSDHNRASHFRTQVEYLRNLKGLIEGIDILRLEFFKEDIKSFSEKYSYLHLDYNRVKDFKKESNSKLKKMADSPRNRQLVKALFKDDYDFLKEFNIYGNKV